MTDIFFSYKSDDRERVRPVRDAFAAQGFDVFWDQQVPAGVDWDTWIRQHLTQSKCAIVFWSATSVLSDNVRHEATVAKQQGKLIPVLLELLRLEQFPMGLYTQQAANLTRWKGDFGDQEWAKLRREVETRLTPLWLQRTIHDLEAELVGERARREAADTRAKAFEARVAKEAEAQIGLKHEMERALDEAAAVKARLEEIARARSDLEMRAIELQQRLGEAEVTRAAFRQQAEDEQRKRLAVEDQLKSSERARSDAETRGAELHRRVSEAETRGAAFHQQAENEQRERLAVESQLKKIEQARSEKEMRIVELQRRLSEAETSLTAAQGRASDERGKRLAAEGELRSKEGRSALEVHARRLQQDLGEAKAGQAAAQQQADDERRKRHKVEGQLLRLKERAIEQRPLAKEGKANRTTASFPIWRWSLVGSEHYGTMAVIVVDFCVLIAATTAMLLLSNSLIK